MTEETLFALALQTPGAERAALLDRECASNPDLRVRVEALLQAHADSGDFLPAIHVDETAPYSGSPGTSRSEQPGTVIAGKYKLVKRIGHGAMGAVWMAEQSEPVKRQVAVKLILADRGQSRRIVARFEAERQAIALMDHPHIARLFDAGTTADGAPFFVMELIQGVELTDYCDQHQLSVPDRLHLFVQICSAVQHAHQKGIIHRDLKPANILVESHDGKPVPKVIDFGLAKATGGLQLTEHTLSAHLDAIVGTPLYMAPEQATFNAVDVDTRADIYSLGVILYELLTGSTPIEREQIKKAALDEVLRVIREQEPPTPSKRLSTTDSAPSVAANRHTEPVKLTRLVQGDLDWIVMRALEKDRNRRYETANGLAEDIERFLNHEPVSVGPPTVRYRLRKFVKRNKAQVVAGGLVLLTLVLGMTGTTFGLVRADSRRLDAEQAREHEADQRAIADVRRQEAESRRLEAEQARADEAEQRVIAMKEKQKAETAEQQTLLEFGASTDDTIEQLIGSKPELGPHERAYLNRTLKRWQNFAARLGNDERSRAIRAVGHSRVAYLWAKLGRREEALKECEIARDLQEKLVEQFPDKPIHQKELAGTHINMGLLQSDHNQHNARLEYEQARVLQKKLVAQFPADSAYQKDLATTHINLGNLLADLNQSDAAKVEYENALDLQKKLVAQFPTDAAYQKDLAMTHVNLGNLLADINQSDAAKEEYRQARDLNKKLVEQFSDRPAYKQELARTHNCLGILLKGLSHRDAARVEYEKACDLQKELVKQFPAVPSYQKELAMTHDNLAILLVDLGQSGAAKVEYRQARDLLRKVVEQFPAEPTYKRELATNHHNLGNLLADLGEFDSARVEYEIARDLLKNLLKQFPAVPDYQQVLAKVHNSLGNLLPHLRQGDAAVAEYEQAIDLQKKLVKQFRARPDYQRELAITHSNLGSRLADCGQHDAAQVEYKQAINLQNKLVELFPAVPDYRQDLAGTHNILGNLLVGLDQRDAARAEYEQARDLCKKLIEQFPTVPDYQMELARTHNNLGIVLKSLGKHDNARLEYKRACDLREKLVEHFPAVPVYQLELGGSYFNIGRLVRDDGHPAESLSWFDKAIATFDPVHRAEPREVNARLGLLKCHVGRAMANHALKKCTEAIKDWDRAIQLSPPAQRGELRASRARSLVLAGQVAEAVAEIADLTKASNWPPVQWYNFACVYAVASGRVPDKKQEYADRAVELLRQAVKAGYKIAADMLKDPDLDSLRDREDFKKLLADLEAKLPGKPETAPLPAEKK